MNVQKWLNQYNKKKSIPKSKDAIAGIDRYDREDLEQIAKDIAAYRAARDKLCDVAENTGGHLTDDTTMSFYKVEPELIPANDMDQRFLINHAVQEELQKTPEWQRLRTWTQGDLINTATSFVDVEEILESLFDKVTKRIEELNQEIEDHIRDLEVAIQEADEEAEANGGELGVDGCCWVPSTEDKIGDLIEQLENAEDKLKAEVNGAVRGKMPDLRTAMNGASEKAQSLAGAANSFGIDPGQLQRMPAAERIKLAQRLDRNDKFKNLTELVGKMQRIAQAEQTRKVFHSFEEVYDIETGDDISRLLPSELLNLANPLTKLDFYRRWIDKQTYQYAMRGNEKIGKGAIIFDMDNSGSMCGQREIWAKSIGLAMLTIAKAQNRSFYGLHFGSQRELMEFDFSTPERITLDAVMNYAEFFYGGGPLRVDQRVVTPTGWTPIGAIKVGNRVIGRNGKPVDVIGVYPQGVLNDMFKVTFKDGAEVICDATHLWTVTDRGRSGYAMSSPYITTKTLKLSEMIDLGLTCTNGYRFAVPMTEPVVLSWKSLPIDPYLLGTLIGNGGLTHTSPGITVTPGDELPWENLLPEGVTSVLTETRPGFAPSFLLTAGRQGHAGANPLTEALRDLGLWGHDAAGKFIPEDYLWGSIEQRWALLQGLCDTDGSYSKPGRLEYSTVSEKLADGIVQLVQSLGAAARVRVLAEKPEKGEQALHRVSIMLNANDCPFRLARKVDQWTPRHHPWIRSIVAVERIEAAECVCIKVDNEDGLFLTEGHVVTHNTDFERPLTRSLELLQQEEASKGFVDADIVFVTDGYCSVNPQWLEEFVAERERLNFKVWGIVIGGSPLGEPLNTICDGNVITVQDLLSGDSVRAMFREV